MFLRSLATGWLLSSIAGFVLPRAAWASEASSRVAARLDWQAPAGDCPTAREFTELAAQRMGRPVFGPTEGDHDVLVRARIERRAEQWLAVVELRDTSGRVLGRRELVGDGPACHDLSESLALVVGLMLDYAPSENRAPDSRSPIRVPESLKRPWKVSLGALAEVAFGLLPSATPGVGVDLSVISPSSFTLDVSGFWLANSNIPSSDQILTARALRVAICPLSYTSRVLRGKLCASQQTVLLTAEDQEFPPGRTQEHVSAAIGLRLRLDLLALSPFTASLAGGVELPLSDVAFNEVTLGAPTETYRTAPLFGHATLIAGVELP